VRSNGAVRVLTVGLLTALGLVLPTAAARAARTDPIVTWAMKKVSLPVIDAAYVPSRDEIVALVSPASPLGNELVEIDPETGAIGRHTFVGSDPFALAVSGDGSVVYVGTSGAPRINKVALDSFTIVQSIAMPAGRSARSLVVPPGHANTVVATLSDASFNYSGVYAFVDGVALPNSTANGPVPANLQMTSGSTIWGFDVHYDPRTMTRMTLSPTGVSLASFDASGMPAALQGKVAGGNLLATNQGDLIDPTVPAVLRNFGGKGAFAPTPADNRIAFLDPRDGFVKRYVLSTGVFVDSRQFSGLPNAKDLTATATGFAAWTEHALYLLGPSVTGADVVAPQRNLDTMSDLVATLLPIKASDVAYDASRGFLYASVANGSASYANEVVALDPTTGVVDKELPIAAADPAAMAISDDNSTLYVVLNATHEIARVDLASFTETAHWTTNNPAGPVSAADLEVMPGAKGTVAAASGDMYSSEGVVLYTDGVALPHSYSGSGHIAFANATTLYGTSQNGYFWQYSLDATGIRKATYTATGSTNNSISPQVTWDGHVAWESNGLVFNPATNSIAGRMGAGDSVVDRGHNRVFRIGWSGLTEYELDKLRPIASRSLSVSQPPFGELHLVAAGTGFAATPYEGLLLFRAPLCNGLPATIQAFTTSTVGTPGDDVIVGTPGAEAIDGGGGNDTICGLEGNDTLTGGTGADYLDGGDGTDTVRLTAGTAAQHVTLDDVADDGTAGEKDNVRPNNEVILGSEGADTIVGTSGNDALFGLGGDDTLQGGDGDDTIAGGTGADDLDGQGGYDNVRLGSDTQTRYVTIDDIANDGVAGEHDNVRTSNEVIIGSPGSDRILGSSNSDTIAGNGGDDLVYGAGGNDTLTGGAGNDRLVGGDGDDAFTGGAGDDDLDGGAGTDTVNLGVDNVAHHVDLDNVADDGASGERDNVRSTNEAVIGTPGSDTIVGNDDPQTLVGGGGKDTLYGLGGDDHLQGGDGDDTLFGGLGADACDGGAGANTSYGCEGSSPVTG
jgi:Ca2+-binding RTX toxin-like protein